MVTHTDNLMDDTRKRLTRSYHIALMMVSLVIIGIAFITGVLVSDQIDDTKIIDIAGSQRMFSQRIELFTENLLDANNETRPMILQKLKSAIDQMEINHQLLLDDAIATDKLPGMQEQIKAMYLGKPMQLDLEVEAYLASARDILNLNVNQLTHEQPEIKGLINLGRGKLLDLLDNAVSLYESETVKRFNALHHIVLGLSMLALFMLAVIALVIFKPAIAYVGQAQRRLKELNQLKGDFLANMSHEIRTPMNGIFGMTELLLDSELNQRQQHYARTLQNSADHLLGLINDILDFSKLEAGQMKLDPIRFNLLATIEDALELLSARAREKNLELLLRYTPGTPRFIVADPGRIRQLLFNLVGNAIKFTDHGYVMVHAGMVPAEEAPDSRMWLDVRIEDTGIGIPEDKIAALFEKFMQVESGSTRAREGTGLGLAICKHLVEIMGGNIHVTSKHGKGTVFSWQIPLTEASEPQLKESHHQSLLGRRVLLVDDLAPNRLLYKESLTVAGILCLVAENAGEALSILNYELVNGRKIDAVVTDFMMPVTNGLQLTQLIKSNDVLKSIPVIILSSAGEQGLIKQFDKAGVAACLAKPATRQQFFDTLSHVIQASERGETQRMITGESNVTMNVRRLLTREKPLYGTHILLVEDNRVNLEITTEMLNQLGCEVTTAMNGREAIDAAKVRPFDLIFMDCQMPEMDGFEAARHIVSLKAEGKISPVPIVALTANALKGDRERCLESGMDDYISKPMRKANLEAILLKWLREKLEANAVGQKELVQPVQEAPEVIQATAGASPSDYGIDNAAFSATRDMLGNKLVTVLGYYLEDAEGYISRIAEAAGRDDPASAVVPAHTLKSSSRQFGVTQIAELAARIENAARSKTAGYESEDMNLLVPGMHEALQRVRPFFMSLGVS